jgi:hypothetical protein
MNYCCLYCIGGCGHALFGTGGPDMSSDLLEGSCTGTCLCSECEAAGHLGEDHPFKVFTKREEDIRNDVDSLYSGWQKQDMREDKGYP